MASPAPLARAHAQYKTSTETFEEWLYSILEVPVSSRARGVRKFLKLTKAAIAAGHVAPPHVITAVQEAIDLRTEVFDWHQARQSRSEDASTNHSALIDAENAAHAHIITVLSECRERLLSQIPAHKPGQMHKKRPRKAVKMAEPHDTKEGPSATTFECRSLSEEVIGTHHGAEDDEPGEEDSGNEDHSPVSDALLEESFGIWCLLKDLESIASLNKQQLLEGKSFEVNARSTSIAISAAFVASAESKTSVDLSMAAAITALIPKYKLMTTEVCGYTAVRLDESTLKLVFLRGCDMLEKLQRLMRPISPRDSTSITSDALPFFPELPDLHKSLQSMSRSSSSRPVCARVDPFTSLLLKLKDGAKCNVAMAFAAEAYEAFLDVAADRNEAYRYLMRTIDQSRQSLCLVTRTRSMHPSLIPPTLPLSTVERILDAFTPDQDGVWEVVDGQIRWGIKDDLVRQLPLLAIHMADQLSLKVSRIVTQALDNVLAPVVYLKEITVELTKNATIWPDLDKFLSTQTHMPWLEVINGALTVKATRRPLKMESRYENYQDIQHISRQCTLHAKALKKSQYHDKSMVENAEDLRSGPQISINEFHRRGHRFADAELAAKMISGSQLSVIDTVKCMFEITAVNQSYLQLQTAELLVACIEVLQIAAYEERGEGEEAAKIWIGVLVKGLDTSMGQSAVNRRKIDQVGFAKMGKRLNEYITANGSKCQKALA